QWEGGLNRFVWDLHYPDAPRFKGLAFWAGSTRGPLAVPGPYKARPAVGNWSETREFKVLKDPRVKTTQEELQKQFDLLVRIRDRLSAANDAVKQIREIKDQVDGVAGRARHLQDGPDGKGRALARQQEP